MNELEIVKKIAEEVYKKGGRTFFVGGYVRDILRNKSSNDYDIEIHNIDPSILEDILSKYGELIKIGASFGIYNIKGYNIDIALPRIERLNGKMNHKDFTIDVNPNLDTHSAARRRDFTINALLQDVLTGEIIDHFNGKKDLENKIIHHVDDESFVEDPLRVLRACMFASRFEFTINNDTIKLCGKIDLSLISKERIFEEVKKVLLKAKKPSIFFNYLKEMNQLSYWFKELEDLIGCNQNPIYHPEKDVWNHTMNVIDAAASIIDKISEENQLMFMLSALCHDMGKPICTTIDEKGVIHSIGHEKKGIKISESFLLRITNDKNILSYVKNMVECHMMPNIYAHDKSKISATNKLFDKSICPNDLIYLSYCDLVGSLNPNPSMNLPFLFDRLDIYLEYMKRPYVKGSDLLNKGYNPSIKFHEALDLAHKLRLQGKSFDFQLKEACKILDK